MRRILILMAALLWASPVAALELPSLFEGVRPLGMGGAFTAVADDENALFYNPAGLNRIDSWGMAVLNPLIDASEENFDFYKDVEDTDLDTTSEVVDLLRDHLGENFHLRAAIFPHYVRHNFGLGVLGQVKVNAEVSNPAFPETSVEALGTASAHLGGGYAFRDGQIKVGAAVKYVSASRLDETYLPNDITDPGFEDRVEDDMEEGSGIGFDIGAMAELPFPFDPIVALAVFNVADTDLGDAGTLAQQINLGVSASHDIGPVTLIGAADWVDVTDNVGIDDDVYKRLHFGLEAQLPRILSLRAGLYQGYGSLGATLDFKALRIDYANYSEEVGSFAGSKSDRRHVAQVSLGW